MKLFYKCHQIASLTEEEPIVGMSHLHFVYILHFHTNDTS